MPELQSAIPEGWEKKKIPVRLLDLAIAFGQLDVVKWMATSFFKSSKRGLERKRLWSNEVFPLDKRHYSVKKLHKRGNQFHNVACDMLSKPPSEEKLGQHKALGSDIPRPVQHCLLRGETKMAEFLIRECGGVFKLDDYGARNLIKIIAKEGDVRRLQMVLLGTSPAERPQAMYLMAKGLQAKTVLERKERFEASEVKQKFASDKRNPLKSILSFMDKESLDLYFGRAYVETEADNPLFYFRNFNEYPYIQNWIMGRKGKLAVDLNRPLADAIVQDDEETLEVLLGCCDSEGAPLDLNYNSNVYFGIGYPSTMLHEAAKSGNDYVVQTLLERGGSHNAREPQLAQRPVDVAGSMRAAKVLRDWEAKAGDGPSQLLLNQSSKLVITE
eukprot:CAMPEP_0170168156 /NCGR_PEP_ID=MMETSP0040_2-20121228/1311_1 /TAXON_ID=641309 /ORGANISM="Lotharella oceanica, Strain CCMP622" /LENGTH=385 /DNA_ID=CAMNT_0010406355 /DNA_START=409 /DNA_END=1566 /DNA_ORIENTATION=-